MTPFKPAIIPREQAEELIAGIVKQFEDGDGAVLELFKGMTLEEVKASARVICCDELHADVFLNDTYQVSARMRDFPDVGGVVHLSIKRIDRQPIHDWRDLQAIKNELVGPECEAIELYPAESRLVDTANQYHLWVFPDPKYRVPIGFTGERVVTNKSINGAVQRPFRTTNK